MATNEIDRKALSWVQGEIKQALDGARDALDSYVADPEQSTYLDKIKLHLHQVTGTLKMLGVYGANLLADEMVTLTNKLELENLPRKEQAFEVLMRAIIQLPTYLDNLQKGQRDIPIVLLPLLNDIRAICGDQLLTESAFFNPDVDSYPKKKPGGKNLNNAKAMAKKYRPVFQLSLVGVFRGTDFKENIKRIAHIFVQMERIVCTKEEQQLWWVAGGLAEALYAGGLEISASIRHLLGMYERHLKLLMEHGEIEHTDYNRPELLKNTLYYIAQSDKRGKRVKELIKAFKLESAIPSQEELHKAQDSLLGLDGNLMEDVAVAIKDNLVYIKEAIDVYSRATEKKVQTLEPVLDKLKTVADTLGMLGFGKQRESLVQQYQAIASAINSNGEITDTLIMELASGLLYIESSLSGRQENAQADNLISQSEYDELVSITANEAKNVLAKIKDAITSFAADTSQLDLLEPLTDQIQSIAGAMTILQQEQGSQLFKKLGSYITQNLQNDAVETQAEEFHALADIITGGEYFIEAVIDDPVGARKALDVMEEALKKLNFDTAPAVAPIEQELVSEPAAEIVTTITPHSDTQSDENDIDEEVMEIFLEEVDEEAQSIKENLVKWQANNNDEDALTTLRRSFHTIKGSGRIVGATVIGEFAWAIENLLNRVIDKTVAVSDDLFTILNLAKDIVPELIGELKGQGPTKYDIDDISAQAHAVAKGESLNLEAAATEENVSSATDEIEVEALDITEEATESTNSSGVDPILAEIFINETRNHLRTIDEFVAGCTDFANPCKVNHPLMRALHTLHGSASMAGIIWVVDLSDSLEKYAKQQMQAESRLSEDFLQLLSDCVTSIKHLLDTLNTEPVLPDREQLELRAQAFLLEDVHAQQSSVAEDQDDAVADISAPDMAIDEEQPADFHEEIELTGTQEDALSENRLDDETDAELIDIFIEEATEILGEIEILLENSGQDITQPQVLGSLQRSLHTLKGGARMAGLTDIGNVAHDIETIIQTAIDSGKTAGQGEYFALIQGSHDWIASAIDRLKQGILEPVPAQLSKQIEDITNGPGESADEVEEITYAADAELEAFDVDDTFTADVTEEIELAGVESDLAENTLANDGSDFNEESISATEVVSPVDDLMIDEDADVNEITLEFVDDSDTDSQDLAVELAAADDLEVIDLEDSDSEPEAIAVADELAEHVADTTNLMQGEEEGEDIASDVMAVGQYDEDLLDVFLEEAHEILEATDGLLQTWARDPANKQTIQEIQRALHTMKGGARMARVTYVGDLSHSIETALEALDQGRTSNAAELVELVQASYDWLSEAIEKIKAGQALAAPGRLIHNIEVTAGLRKGKVQPMRGHAPATAKIQPAAAEKEADEAITKEAAEADDEALIKVLSKMEPELISKTEQAAASTTAKQGGELIRVNSDTLEHFINNAGEMSIYRSRMDQQLGTITYNLVELDHTVERIREQLRKFEIEAETQILYRYESTNIDDVSREDFDPLELDRFSNMQQLSRSLAETVGDLSSIQKLIYAQTRETEILLVQQSRINSELQNGLMSTRLVPFSSSIPRLRRIVRQTSKEVNKEIELKVVGAEEQIDRMVLNRLNPALEHMIRNAIDHGIESPELRKKSGKNISGTIHVDVSRLGGEILITIQDDGKGMDLSAIRKKAVERGLMGEGADLSDNEILQFVLESGFSTADKVTQLSGRGVGMDVVNTEIKQLGGILQIQTDAGKGTRFTIRLPLTVSVNQALIVLVGDQTYAIPLVNVMGVIRANKEELERMQSGESTHYDYAGTSFKYFHLGSLMEICRPQPVEEKDRIPLILARAGDHQVALQSEAILGRNEVVIKTVGPQISSVKGISGATIMGDGSVALILDIPNLIRSGIAHISAPTQEEIRAKAAREQVTIMVVDDSITVRKVTERLLKRNNMATVTAKDGLDALDKLQEIIPDLILSDIEMPRMDGYELISAVRRDSRLKDIPVIMITSRTGDKHRERAMDIGVNEYLGKPFQDTELLEHISRLLSEKE